MSQNIVKNQRYIPEFVLWNFVNSDDKFFETLLNKKTVYPTSPPSSMSARFIYEDDHLKTNTVENFFSKIETEAAPKLKEVIKKIEQFKNGTVDDIEENKVEIESLLPIFLLFYYRSGALLTEFSSIQKEDKIPLLSKKILNEHYIKLLADTIKNGYKFALIESVKNFLLSDQFISTAGLKIKCQFMNISNRHMGLKDTLILIPLSSSFYVAYWHSTDSFILEEEILNSLSN
ncbi:DUF4238 domain-containing protein [Candidatus Dojkabacteria bacterium]|nr:DUF4238 domain-containing protein [Candidatus Dojkabacteria bacterium]